MSTDALTFLNTWVWPVIHLVGLYVGLMFLLSCCGWLRFARRLPAPVRPAGKAYPVRGAEFRGPGTYRNVMRIIFTEQGIHACSFVLFRLFHGPFLVPWSSVKRVEKKWSLFRGRHYYVYVDDPVAGYIFLYLPLKVEEELFRYYPRPVENRERVKEETGLRDRSAP